jgi:Oxidoreductase NAD-binding domain
VLVTWGEAYWFLADVLMAREAKPGVPPGIVSNWLHDQAGPVTVLKVAPPAGEFSLNEKEDNPVVVSSGVGLKPMVSMLEHVVHSGTWRPLWYVHGAENGRVHAMGMHVRDLAAQARNVTVRTFYNVPDPGDQAGRDYDERGLIHRQLARPQHADRGGRVLPLRPAAVPARDGRRHGAHQHGAQPHPLRVLRSRRRAAGGLKRGHGQSHNTLTYQISAGSAQKSLPGEDCHAAPSG